jgi:leucyl-tRNA synthetase
MFPYPSGTGLHMGHTEQAAITDTFYRFKRMNNFNVLHPQGFDSFGLPAENFAIKTGISPAETIEKTTKNFRKQIDNLGLGYDFMDGKVTTSNPEYYKHTQ